MSERPGRYGPGHHIYHTRTASHNRLRARPYHYVLVLAVDFDDDGGYNTFDRCRSSTSALRFMFNNGFCR